jgi:hypothetical protein
MYPFLSCWIKIWSMNNSNKEILSTSDFDSKRKSKHSSRWTRRVAAVVTP